MRVSSSVAIVSHVAGVLLAISQLASSAPVTPSPSPSPSPSLSPSPSPSQNPNPNPTLGASPSAASRTLTFDLAGGEVVPEGKANTWVYVPEGFDPNGDLHLAFIFHGFKNCIASYTGRGESCVTGGQERPGYSIAKQLERAGAKAIVVVPETSYDIPIAEAPRLMMRKNFRVYLREVLAALGEVTGGKRLAQVTRLALIASSGGYQALEPILDGATDIVTDVLLLDAGYMYTNSTVARFMAAAARELGEGPPVHRVGLLYTPSGGALDTSEDLLRFAERKLYASGATGRARLGRVRGDPSDEDLEAPMYVLRVHEDHDVVVRRNLGRVIARAGL